MEKMTHIHNALCMPACKHIGPISLPTLTDSLTFFSFFKSIERSENVQVLGQRKLTQGVAWAISKLLSFLVRIK